jgi:hypothetical protein
MIDTKDNNNEILEIRFKMFCLYWRTIVTSNPTFYFAMQKGVTEVKMKLIQVTRVLHQCHQHSEAKYTDTWEKMTVNYTCPLIVLSYR